ncbi:MAG: adenylate/guanylate cyclase domain-containing protein [Candidatus Rokubacteria bacterium]|nr:adenylate/guanylate cyclase domain-containing protein [Candidatus Rokubacteria bacterium]
MGTSTVRRLRLVSGLVLFTYLTTHLANHALGLVSLETMGAGREWFLALWRHPLATLALYTALVTHGVLALASLWLRHTLRMPAWETAQLTLGIAIPAILVPHVVGTRLAHELYGVQDLYARVVLALWVVAPERGLRQTLLVVLAWAHGCIGLHYWLRFRPWYPRVRAALFAAALLLPALALLGFVTAGRAVAALARTPGWTEALARATNAPDGAASAALAATANRAVSLYATALVLVMAARAARQLYRRRFRSVRISYPGDRTVTVPVGFTVLEASRHAGLPHASVCGGRGRCSTCRVRVTRGLDALAPAGDAERRVLERVGAAADVRLACQIRPGRDVAVVPLLPATMPVEDALAHADTRQGSEREVVVLFADLRGFTRMAEHKLPYDVVFLLNRYFETVGAAVIGAGGVTNQFTGDGVMALFGLEAGPATGCRQALAAARAMVSGVTRLSRELAGELDAPLRLGIGIHAGPAVVGRMGWGESFYLTAVGDTVHVAARLEQATKDYGCELVVSDAVARHAGLDRARFPRHDLAVRNRAGQVAVHVIERVAALDASTSSRELGA